MARKKRKYRRRRHTKIKLKQQTVFTIIAISLFVAAALLLLSFLQSSVLLSPINQLIRQYFGIAGILVPVVLVFYGLFFLGGSWMLGQPHTVIGASMIVGVVIVLGQAGSVGEDAWRTLSVLLSSAGAFVVLLATLIIGIAVLFNTSFDQLFTAALTIFKTIKQVLFKTAGVGTALQDKAIFPGDKKQITIKGGQLDDRTPAQQQDFSVNSGKKDKVPDRQKPPKELEQALVANQQQNGLPFWEYPQLSLLADRPTEKAERGDLNENAGIIERTLNSFGINAKVVEVNLGPAVTQYALNPALGTKLSKITALSNDLALALAAPTGQIRIEAPIPGRNLLGIEVPNRSLEFVTLKHMLESRVMRTAKSKLTVSLGLDVSGDPMVADISGMPHILVAGTTGSGKSVLLNSFICTLLYRTTPQEVKIILIDPKRVELFGYNGIPHLLTPVIVDKDKILSSLKWATQEMERRYKLFSEVGVRNIDGYNELSGFQALPYIVIVVDELADLMMYAASDVEDTVVRIAQMARATGMHLVIATQRPSVNVITGLIKANVPCRVAFNVSSMVDSRVILDMPGAEKLLGRGDMLYIPPGKAKPVRVQGTFVSDVEVKKLVEFLKSKNAPVEYTEEVTSIPVSTKSGGVASTDEKDDLFDEAVQTVCQHDRASASLLQRRLSVGYARAARILDQLEAEGIVSPAEGSKPREVLVASAEEYFARTRQDAATVSPENT